MNNRLIFGAGKIHHLVFPWERQRTLLQAIETGFRAFDVAPAYGNGLNEIELGIAIRRNRGEFQLTTKFGIPVPLYGAGSRYGFPVLRAADKFLNPSYGKPYEERRFSGPEMRRSLEGSLSRLGSDYIDRLLIHEPLQPIGRECLDDLVAMAASLKTAGKLRSFGIAGPLRSVGPYLDRSEIEVVQTPASDIDQIPDVRGRCKVAYGVYRHFDESVKGHTRDGRTFQEFVRAALNKGGDTHLILSTLSVERLKGFGALFQ